ncbi:MAG: hypothetical protein ACHQRJ_17500 [Alphaproteobacteria bacterium]
MKSMKRMALTALMIAAASAALYTGVGAQTKAVPMAPQPPAVEPNCPAPGPQVIAGNDRVAAQLADIDHNLAAIAYYLCLIESNMSKDK